MKRLLIAALATTLVATHASAEMTVQDAYVRTSTPSSTSGAAFMVLINEGDKDDRLIAAATDVAGRVELHRHSEDANGVMRMGEIAGGIAVPAGGRHALARGGDHVMLMGLDAPLAQGDEITMVLTFEEAGEITVPVLVDSERAPDHGAMDHGAMDHGQMDHSTMDHSATD